MACAAHGVAALKASKLHVVCCRPIIDGLLEMLQDPDLAKGPVSTHVAVAGGFTFVYLSGSSYPDYTGLTAKTRTLAA
jgi:hypothetical protein